MLEKLTSFTKKVADLSDRPSLNPADLKAAFDAAPDEVRQYLNKLIDALKKTEAGDSGAKNIGATTITGLTGTDVQSLLESLKTLADTKLSGAGELVEVMEVPFYCPGSTNVVVAHITFSKPFTTVPIILPGQVTEAVSYADVLAYPYIYNQSKTGCSIQLHNYKDGLFSSGTLRMKFLIIGK